MTYSAEVLADSPIGYWRLGDPSGTNATDSSGNSHPGTYTNGPILAQTGLLVGDADTAVSFDGSDDFVQLSNPSALRLTAAFTLEGWVKVATGETQFAAVIAGQYTGGSVLYFLGAFDGSNQSLKPSVGFFAGGTWYTCQASSSISVNAVHHLVGTWDGTSLKIYVDGSLANTTTPGTSPVTNTNNFYIGQRWDNAAAVNFFKGLLDDVAIYGSDIGATRIGVHYTAGSTNPNGLAQPATVAGLGAVPAPSATGDGKASPGVTAGIGAIPASTVFSAAIASPARVAGVGAVPAPTAAGAVSGTAHPANVIGIGRVPRAVAEGQGTGGGGGTSNGATDFWSITLAS